MSKKLNDQKNYKQNIKPYQPKPKYVKNCIKAFIIGGLICLIGQLIENAYSAMFDFSEKTAGDYTVGTLILISSLLTGFGVYDRIGQFGGAGALIPITGFANSVTSSALESKSEGIVLGIAMNLFKLAGAVIVFGILSAVVFGLLRVFIGNLM
ncbi:stage V sporulation protein AC [Tuberibacillus sp. Marseille-P3662]|uniref:stage V sporulation protein AC n=1 Tax=Tuberibacillus sp. Marseille-P3662 TaxID=1965358 RepID=UPI000A1C92D7|nr:stage V sporulation protein AC [Tuberibacillus sp. Marseille-P3662]